MIKTFVQFIRELFCKHEWEHEPFEFSGELWSDYLIYCKKCGKCKPK